MTVAVPKPFNVPCDGAVRTVKVSVCPASGSFTESRASIFIGFPLSHADSACGVPFTKDGALSPVVKLRMPS